MQDCLLHKLLPVPPAPQTPAPQSPPVQPVQPPVPPTQPIPTQPIQHMSQSNWSHFKLGFAGKPDEDAEAHLLRMIGWIHTHFKKVSKSNVFCLTLIGEARLWYESLRPINVDWIRLQNQFRQQHSKIGNTRKQLFHTCRSFHFNKNTESLEFLCYMYKTGSYTTML